MGKLIIYEQTHRYGEEKGKTGSPNDPVRKNYYCKVEMSTRENVDALVTGINMYKMVLIEDLLSSSPVMNLKFSDGFGLLFSERQIIPDDEFTISYGLDYDVAKQAKFKISTLDYSTGTLKQTSNIQIASDMVSSNWENLFKRSKSRSWANKRYSEVVKIIAEEIGVESLDIEETKGKFNIVQPNWTNAQMLNWIATKAINKQGLGGYVFCYRLDGSMVFRTFDSLFSEKPVRTFEMANKDQFADGIGAFKIRNKYVPTLLRGGFGINANYYDFNLGKFVSEDTTIEDIDERQMSDWYYLAEPHAEASRIRWYGIDNEATLVAQNRIQHMSNSVHKIDITISGDQDVRVGDLIELIIPISKDVAENVGPNKQYNEHFSGKWMVWKVAHNFDFQNKDYFMSLSLLRNGLNGVKLRGLVRSSKGKSA